MDTQTEVDEFRFLAGGGEMGELIRAFDWSRTPLGPIRGWPQSLKTAISLILSSQHPMWIGWGPAVTFFYNDAYIQVLSRAKHPQALGQPTAQVWSEIWDVCGPLADKVFQKGEPSFVNDVRLFMNRGDFLEETFYSFSYSPIRDEAGEIGGLFCPSTDVTAKVLNTRRLRAVSDLAAESMVEKSTARACASAAAILSKNGDDIPFALIYLTDAEGKSVYLAEAVGVPPGNLLLSPPTIDLSGPESHASLWPVAEVAWRARPQTASLAGVEGFPLGAADQRVTQALVLPLVSRGQERPLGIMVAGVNPTRQLDSDYDTFYELVARNIATAIQNARAVEEEKERADQLAELDRAKTTFFGNISHELRTPLTLILGPLEEELRESAVPNQRLQLAHRNSLRLLKLVNTLLDFSRIEAGRVEPSLEPVDLAAFTRELADVFRSGIEGAGLSLIADCPPLSAPVPVDREMWEKIVFNLLSNAFKFTARGGIAVTLREAKPDPLAPGVVLLSVRDTGIGIPAAELPRVFERFHRIRNPWARSHEGTGIGLALVQELARLHGGTVSVESQEGQGTTFTISIPIANVSTILPRSTAIRAVSRGLPLVDEALQWLPEIAEIAAASGGTGAHTERILLADDNNDMRSYVQRLLAAEGYEVVAVADGQAALEAARARTPCLVLSDVMMPRLDGFGLLRELRADPATRGIPIVLLSARAGEEARIEGVEAGADDYLTKPFSARELLARVATHLQLARIRREAEQAIRLREEEANRARQTLQTVLNSITDGLAVLDKEWRYTYFSASAARMLGLRSEDLIGHSVWDLFPQARGTQFEESYHRAVATRQVIHFEEYLEPLDRWLECHCYPSDAGLSVYFHDVTARKRAEAALREANALLADRAEQLEVVVGQRTAKLRETIEELESFSYSIAHDMRAPLRSLQGFSEILLDDYKDKLDADGCRFLQRIATAAGRMDKLIQDILNYSRVVRGELPLETVDLGQLLHGIVETYPMFAPDRAEIVLEPSLPRVLGNEAMLMQIFSNLMGNAVKFVPSGTRPRLRVWSEPEAANPRHVRVFVQDNGIGIAADQHEKIFAIFQQASQGFDGTGIGLAIVKKAVERMGGKVGVMSEPGRGSTFWIEVPTA